MFRFFRARDQKDSQPLPDETTDIYELNDEQVEQLIGGAPIHHPLVRPIPKNGPRAVPGQQFNGPRSVSFQEAFTLQSTQQNLPWSHQKPQGQAGKHSDEND